jgi:hypothetical protein
MKLLLLKSLLQRRARDKGFTLPMVIALGLVMLLLGAISIVKSSEENISAISQNSSSDALAIAEVGVTKYRELLNQNRILTVYNHNQWNDADVDAVSDVFDNVSTQTCNDMTTTPTGWEDGGTAAAPNSTTKWWQVKEDLNGDGDTTDDGEFIGEYQLVSYEYDRNGLTGTADTDRSDENGIFSLFSDADVADDSEPGLPPHSITDENDTDDDGESDAVGILTVQGRSPDETSVAQIEVEIPLRINDLESFAPVLWVGSGAIANSGTLNMSSSDDNIVLRSAGTECPSPTIPGTTNVTSNAFTEPRSLPAIDTLPTDITKKNTIGAIDTSGSRLLLPRTSASDNQDDNERFLYEVTTIDVATNDLVTDGIAEVALYATGNINIDGAAGTTRTIGNSNAANAGGNFANFNAGSTTNTSVSSRNLEIYGSDTTTQIDINTNGGTVNIEAFIHAPDATLNITGSGTVNINGAVWVNNFNNSGATVNIRSDQTDIKTGSEPSYKFYTTSATMSPRPLTSTPTNWVREEVQ